MINEIITDREFKGERPLYHSQNISLQNVTIHKGESSVKESNNVVSQNSTFEGKYVFWECNEVVCQNCTFDESARSSIWYSNNIRLIDCNSDAPKMFRRSHFIDMHNCCINNGEETFWDCDNIHIDNSKILNCDYLFMHSTDINIYGYEQHGNYSFQYAKNVNINNASIESKDAFWESENVTIYNSQIDGEYLGWYSKNLTLVNCVISGQQPLCYCENLTIINCEFADDCNLAFEYSSVNATIDNKIKSIKNPTSGTIKCADCDEIIWDENYKGVGNIEIYINNELYKYGVNKTDS